jgi:large subunit ribosomal protein L18
MIKDRKLVRQPVRKRVRNTVKGDAARPRVAAFRSSSHIYVQAIDDLAGVTLAQASTLDAEMVKKLKGKGGTVKAATEVGSLLAERLKAKGIETIVFDRGGFVYHGRVKATAEAMRKAGIKF